MEDARRAIVRRAGATRPFLVVKLVGDGATHGPKLVRATRRRGRKLGRERHVIVSVQWLRREAPELWAPFVAAHILGTEPLIILSRKEAAR